MATIQIVVPPLDGSELTDRLRKLAENEAARQGGELGAYLGFGPLTAPAHHQGHLFAVHLPDPPQPPALPANQTEFTCPGCGKVSSIVFVPTPREADRTVSFPPDGGR